ncbi:unnamed protein product [Angiostrongylus costaricensis]|uniref:TFIIS N-terminal domain-containing protein n=1 Tax=Angiostrongylus costaricensis TaxID=334426 RepID=A0A158PEN2_ANGCS|nr:unnamed protein product [Angiostrongylus costaricensis]
MTSDDEVLSKVTKYGKLIKRKEKISHALRKLSNVEMTLDILSATNIGRCVNKLCDDPVHGREAFRIIEKWKEIARRGGARGGEDDRVAEGGNLQACEQLSSTRDGLSRGVRVKPMCYDEVKYETYERDTYNSSDADAHVNKGDQVVRRRSYHGENKTGACESSDTDSEGYRRRRDNKDYQSRHRNENSRRNHEDYYRNSDEHKYDRKQKNREVDSHYSENSRRNHEDRCRHRDRDKYDREQKNREAGSRRGEDSRRSYEDHYRHRDKNKYDRKEKSRDADPHRREDSRSSYEDHYRHHGKDKYDQKQETIEADSSAESRNGYDSSSGLEWDEQADDDHPDKELESASEEYGLEPALDKVEREHLDSYMDERNDSASVERQSSSRIGNKRRRSPENEVHLSPDAKSRSKTTFLSTPCSNSPTKPVDSSLLPSSTSKKVVPDFDSMLLSGDSSPTKSRKPREAHWKWAEPPTLNNYQPFPQSARATKELTHTPAADNFDFEHMFKPRNERGKVFAGRRRIVSKEVTPLFNLCLRVLMNNTRVLFYAEFINFDVVKPILEKCTPDELAHIERKHRYLEEDTGELWKRFVSKKYPGEELRYHNLWKELYYFLEKEKEEKLKQVTLRIGKMHNSDSMKRNRTAILADATAPTFVKRRQIRHGTTNVPTTLPSALELSSARRKIFETGGTVANFVFLLGSKDALAALPAVMVKPNSASVCKTENKKAPSKKGALMIKTMRMLKIKRK